MWEPSNEIEHRLREALRSEDQDGYFRTLSQIELVLPLSYESAGGTGADTWATWTTDDRTHILAFTSETALQVCLRDNAGASRRVTFQALAAAWPDEEWWLAVNPGLPIEGYLPAWFVTQVAQGMTTVPADPAPTDDQRDPFAAQGQYHAPDQFAAPDQFGAQPGGDPFANPMAPPAAPAARESFMPTPPPVPEVPPAPRRSADLNGSSGAHSTVAGTTGAGLPLRQPPRGETEPEGFGGQAFNSQPPAGMPPGPASQPPGFASPTPQGFAPQPQGYTSQPPQGFGSQPGESAFPAEPSFPTAQDQWPDAPDWLRDQQPDPLTLPTREPAAPAIPEPFSAGESFGAPPQREAYSPQRGDAFGTPPSGDAFGGTPGAAFGGDEPRSAEAFASMSSAFGRRQPAEAAEPPAAREPAAPEPVELSGEDAEPVLSAAATSGDTAGFLQTLLCTTVILPVGDPAAAHLRVGDPAFRWSSDIVDGNIGVTVYTTEERMRERAGEDTAFTVVPFGWLIQHWPSEDYALYVNPGTAVGANMSGPEIEPLLKWAEAKDLLVFAREMERRQAAEARRSSPAHRVQPVLWQKTIPHHQVAFYLERGYDRVGGFVHPVEAVQHLRTPAQLYLALGLIRSSEDFSPTDDSVHVLRWTGYRTDLYPAAIGGNDQATAQSRGGIVVEPGPFRGDGFAPSESPDDRIPEHKVESVRLPHGAKILRIDSRGEVTEIALYDSDSRDWTPVDGAFGGPAAIEAPPVQALPASSGGDVPMPAGPMGEAYGWDAQGHYDLVRPTPEDRAASVLDHRGGEWNEG